jgi:hypothetical protein
MAVYSPKLNLVEYVIHWIGQEILHYADARKSLFEFQTIIENLCGKGETLDKKQIINILSYIEALVYKNTNLSAERE